LRAGELLTWQQRGESNSRRGQAVSLEDALDGARVGERVEIEGLEFGPYGRGLDEAVASGWRGVSLPPASEGKGCSLRLGRDALGDMVVGPCPVLEALGAGLQVAVPPLAEPSLTAAQSEADLLDRAASEPETDGALARGELVLHSVLRGATAGGCPRGT